MSTDNNWRKYKFWNPSSHELSNESTIYDTYKAAFKAAVLTTNGTTNFFSLWPTVNAAHR